MITQRVRSAAVGTLGRAQRLRQAGTTRQLDSRPMCLDIGLVNNMPDAALDATVRQFRVLLGAAADDMVVRLTLYTLPEVPRTDLGRQLVSGYSDINELWDSRLDGLIVTGQNSSGRPRGRALLEKPDASSRVGRAPYLLDDPLLPGRTRRYSAHRWHRPPATGRQALRRLRMRARLGSPIDRRRSEPSPDAAIPVE